MAINSGNREPRFSDAQEKAIQDVLNSHFLNSNAPNIRHCHRILQNMCNKEGITAPSYTTFRKRVNDLTQKETDTSRFGKRMNYQRGDFVDVLYADTPVHGSRAFQYVHIDHTVLDLELISADSGKSLGRPTLTFAIDAFTRRIVGLNLSFDPPSTKAVMMVMRDMVCRYQRLPQFLVVDNGPDFRSEDFQLLCQLLNINIRRRPAGNARHGAVMERIFGSLHSQYIHNLAGNTKATKHVRQITKSFMPSNLAQWSLEQIYHGISFWAFEFYDNELHSTLGISPREAFENSLAQTGARTHRIIPFSRDFQILTCPSVERQTRTIDRQRGVKVNSNFWYWCEEMRPAKMHGRKVHVRYDPWDASTVFVQIDNQWFPAKCKALVHLNGMTDEERRLYSGEMQRRNLTQNKEEPTAQRLKEFILTFTPKGAMEKALEQQKANRELNNQLGRGAVLPQITTATTTLRPVHVKSPPVAPTVGMDDLIQPAHDETYSQTTIDEDDLPEFPKF